MKKVSVKICSGTTCFIMSGNYLADITDIIKKEFGDRVDVSASNCLEQCSNSHSRAPFVKIDDEIISEATPEKIIMEIEKRIENDK